MDSIKQDISHWLNIEQNCLNEIELEDVQFTPFTRANLDKTVTQMLSFNDLGTPFASQTFSQIEGIPCKGFWIENTKELVLYLWLGNQPRAIIIPQDGWMVKEDIMVH